MSDYVLCKNYLFLDGKIENSEIIYHKRSISDKSKLELIALLQIVKCLMEL